MVKQFDKDIYIHPLQVWLKVAANIDLIEIRFMVYMWHQLEN
jgi:hypothetical protein